METMTTAQEPTTARMPVAKAGSGEPVIRARNLSLWYGAVIGINNINLDIGQGVIGLLGPNGAGKSTLLKCLTGQLHPKAGKVQVLGMPVDRGGEVYARVGFVPEQDAFYEEMTGLGFVTYLTRLQGFGAQEAHKLAKKAIGIVSMQEKMDDPIHSYSKGMRQRIKIAQALAHEPDVLFLDEPLTGTDPVGRRHIIDLVQERGERGHTIVVSSHILHEVEQMTSEIILINKGRILADGDIAQIRGMIDAHPHRVFFEVDRPREFGQAMLGLESVRSVEFAPQGNGVFVATTKAEAFYDQAIAVVVQGGFELGTMSSPDNNLMAIFKYLVG